MTLTDSLTYYKHVVPVCKKVTQDACQFFKHFNEDYKDMESFIDEIDELLDETNKFKIAFSICSQMHGPVIKLASLRAL